MTRVNDIVTETRVYGWDNGGNLLSTTVNGQLTVSNVYDVRNQLIGTETAGTTIENAYNGDGLRVRKTIDGEAEFYLLNGDKVVLELDVSGTTIRRNVYGINLVLSQIGSTSYQYLYNGHADVTALILPNGQVAGTWYYDAFGVQTEHTGVDSMYTYSGYRYDDETGLYYLNARMYDPEMARFLQEDTYRGQANDPLSLNLYVYCHNEPLMYWDPTGHSWKEVGEWFGEAYRDITDFVEIPLDVKLCKAVDGILEYSYDNATQAGDSVSRVFKKPSIENATMAVNRIGNYLMMGAVERFGNAATIYTDGHSGTIYKTKAFTIEHATAITWSALDFALLGSMAKEALVPKPLVNYGSVSYSEIGNISKNTDDLIDVLPAGRGTGKEVILDTNAVFRLKEAQQLLKPGETPVITKTAMAELRNLQLQGRMGIPKYIDDLRIIDDVGSANTRINVRGMMYDLATLQKSVVKGNMFADGSIGATVLETRNPIITFDKLLKKTLQKMGGDVR